jgi:hypothetical protein
MVSADVSYDVYLCFHSPASPFRAAASKRAGLRPKYITVYDSPHVFSSLCVQRPERVAHFSSGSLRRLGVRITDQGLFA